MPPDSATAPPTAPPTAHRPPARPEADAPTGSSGSSDPGEPPESPEGTPAGPVTLREVFATWWPLAASWLFMGLELPLVSAVMARLVDPAIHLAAYGGVVFPVALIVEAPVIMLLAASTALAKDTRSYWKMHRFMMWSGAGLTLLHALLAFTPLFDAVVVALLGPPPEIVEPARLGLRIMLPWTWTIAYRRFNQGVLIRFGHSGAVGIGTAIRMASVVATVGAALLVGEALGGWRSGVPGIVVATAAIAVGVTAEALYSGLRVRPVVRGPLRRAAATRPPLSRRAFAAFYLPLALTSLLLLLVPPLGAAAIGRMPLALASLAAWPVVNGLLFMFRSLGYAYNEVVVALLERPGAARALRRFTWLLTGANALALLLLAATPLADVWFRTVSGLSPELAALARQALWLGLLWPALDVVRNYLQGAIVHGGRTRSVTESVALFLLLSGALLTAAVAASAAGALPLPGLAAALGAFVIGAVAQVGWLWWRGRGVLREAARA